MNTARKPPPEDIIDFDGTIYRNIDSLVEGDRVDLIGDPFADPPLPDTVTQLFQMTREVVFDVKSEGRFRQRVIFMSGRSVVFPRAHWFVIAEEC